MLSSAHSSPSHSDRDDDADSVQLSSYGSKDRRRELHTQAEQKRRDAIKHGYDQLCELVAPGAGGVSSGAGGGGGGGGGGSGGGGGGNGGAGGGGKSLSKASILQRSIKHMENLNRQKEAQEKELDRLRKEVMALKIMKMNYEHIVSAGAGSSSGSQQSLPDHIKFAVFQGIMDHLFQSFDRSTSADNFAELSGCVISWLEANCRSQQLHELAVQVLQQVLTQYSEQARQAGSRLS